MSFLLKRLLIPVAVLVALFLGANIALEGVAENRIAQAAATSFDLDAVPQVQIEGFPVLVRIFTGSLPGISFEATDVTIEGLTFREVAVRMRDINAEGGLLRTAGLRVHVSRGEVRAEATDQAVTAFLREQGEDAVIRFHDNRRATVRTRRTLAGRRRQIDAQGTIELLSGRQQLRFVPEEVTVDGEEPGPFAEIARRDATIVMDVPRLPGGFRITTLQSGEGFVALAAVLENFDFPPEQDEEAS